MASTSFDATTYKALTTAGTKLQNDNNAHASASTLTADVIAYYNTQTAVRTYATEAAEVASETSTNGLVANNNVENYVGAANWPTTSVNLKVQLALADFAYVQSTDFIPTLYVIDQEHIQVFGALKIPIQYWSGTALAAQNVNWLYGATAAETSGPSQSTLFASVSASTQASAFADLLWADVQTASSGVALTSFHALSEDAQDDLIALTYFGSLLGSGASSVAASVSKSLDLYVTYVNTASLGTSFTVNVAALASSLGISSAQASTIKSMQATEATSGTITSVTNNSNGTSVDVTETAGGASFTEANYSAANGTGNLTSSATDNSDGTSSNTQFYLTGPYTSDTTDLNAAGLPTLNIADLTGGGTTTGTYNASGWVGQSVTLQSGNVTTDNFAAANVLSTQSVTYGAGGSYYAQYDTAVGNDPLQTSSTHQANGTVVNSNYSCTVGGDPLLSQSTQVPNGSLTVLSFNNGVAGDPLATEGVTATNGDTASYNFNSYLPGDPLLSAVTTIPFNYSTYYTWNNGLPGDPLQVVQTRYAAGNQLVTDYDFVNGNWNYANTAYNAAGQVTQYTYQYANGETTATTLFHNGGPYASQTVTYGWNSALWAINTAYNGGNYLNQNVLAGGPQQIIAGYDPDVPPDPGAYASPSTSIGDVTFSVEITVTGTYNYGGGGSGSEGESGGEGGSGDDPDATTQAVSAGSLTSTSTTGTGSSWDPGANAGTPALPLALVPTFPAAAETLDSGTGASTLTGNGGADTYVIQNGATAVTVENGGAQATAPAGILQFQDGAAAGNLWYLQQGKNLVIDVLGTKAQVTVQNWFGAPQAEVAQILDANGLKLDTALGSLLTAMATFSANNPAFNPQTTTHATLADSSVFGTLSAVDKGAWHG